MPKTFALQVPEPCHENWNEMSPRQQGRFCGSCQKTVVDFSSMSDRQLAEWFESYEGGACGHFAADQLDRSLHVPRKPIPYIRYLFAVMLPAFLISLKGKAQGEQRKRPDTVKTTNQSKPAKPKPTAQECTATVGEPAMVVGDTTMAKPVSVPKQVVLPEGAATRGEVVQMPMAPAQGIDTPPVQSVPLNQMTLGRIAAPTHVIAGQVTDEHGEAIPHASVTVMGTRRGAVSDVNGNFEILVPSTSDAKLQFSSVGCASQSHTVTKDTCIRVVLIREKDLFLDGVVVVQSKKKKHPQPPPPEPDVLKMVMYPNPIHARGAIYLRNQSGLTGELRISIHNASGVEMMVENKNLSQKTNDVAVALPVLAAGVYVVKAIHVATGKQWSEQLVVQ